MMEKRNAKQPVELSFKDAEFGVALLSAEEERRQAERRKFILTIFAISVAMIITYTCPLGLLVIWFNRTLGWMLLAAAILSGAVLLAVYATTQGRAALETSPLFGRGRGRIAGMPVTLPRKYIASMFVVGIAFLSCLGGFAWLVYGLFSTREAGPQSVGLMALSILIFSTGTGVYYASAERYYARVSRLRSELETRLETADAGSAPEIAVTAQDYRVLSRAERVQTRIEIEKAVKEAPIEVEEAYALWKAPDSRLYVKGQPSPERSAIYEALDALQIDARPPNARSATVGEEPAFTAFTIDVGWHRIVYTIDEDKKLVSIHDIHGIVGEEVSDAS